MSIPGPPPEPGPEPSSEDPARSGDPRRGVAYAVAVRSDSDPRNSAGTQTVLTFRLRRIGPDGRLLPPVAVEMRGSVLSGMVADGDLIQLPGAAPHGGALQLSTVSNLTTRSEVVARRPRASTTVTVIVGVLIIGFVLIVVVGLIAVMVLTTGF